MQTTTLPGMKFTATTNWVIFCTICVIWGSSFILMKLGLFGSHGQLLLTYTQVAALRICTAGIVLLPVVVKNFKKVPRKLFGLLVLSGILGNLGPAYLFCFAETRIDSALAGTLNSLAPIFALLLAFFLFKQKINRTQVFGILIGFGGILLLFLSGQGAHHGQISYGLLVILATLSYAINMTLVNRYLKEISAVSITSFSLCAVAIPSSIILLFTGFFKIPFGEYAYQKACLAVCSLGVLSTAVAWLLFYMLVKRTSVLFASTAAYGIPFIAFAWGWIYGENVTLPQFICLVIIIAGVCLTRINYTKKAYIDADKN
jgi:drug/metabolite transporter (DMT)-like permease